MCDGSAAAYAASSCGLSLQDFFFHQLRKIAIGDLAVPVDVRLSLLASSSLHGITFLATSTGLPVTPSYIVDTMLYLHIDTVL